MSSLCLALGGNADLRLNSLSTADLNALLCSSDICECWHVLVLHIMTLTLTAQTIPPMTSTRIVEMDSSVGLLQRLQVMVVAIKLSRLTLRECCTRSGRRAVYASTKTRW